MLELRPNCERCDRDLPPYADARICSYECTFCVECADGPLANVCPNCGGGFVPRPIRPRRAWRDGTGLGHDPPGTRRRELGTPRRRSTSWCRGCVPSTPEIARRAPPSPAPWPAGSPRRSRRRRPRRSTSSTPRSAAGARPRQVVAPSQHVPSSCTARSMRLVSCSSPTPTSTWFRTTSFVTSTPSSASSRSANRSAILQQRSTTSAIPDRPSARSAAQVGEPARPPRRLDREVAAAEGPARDLSGEVGGGVCHRVARASRDERRTRSRSRRGRSATCARRSPTSRPARHRRPAPAFRGHAAAHSPNAPSTCNHAPCSRVAAPIARRSSHAPVLTLPACAHTMVGTPGAAARAASSACGFISPFASAGTVSMDPSPRPSSRSARSIVACRSTLARIRTRGAPHRPSRPASQPWAASTCDRPAAMPTVLAAPAPVTNPTDADAGRCRSSFSQRAGHVFERQRRRGERGVERVLVPAGGQHVGDDGGVDRAADHEAEVARARRAYESRGRPARPARRSPSEAGSGHPAARGRARRRRPRARLPARRGRWRPRA